jgi:hypothetical protein
MERVYEKAHREVKMSQYVESNAMNKHMVNHLYLNHSKQKTEIIKAHVLHPESSFLHITRERDVQVLDPKGLVDKYLEPNTWIQYKCTQLIMRVSKM